MKTLLLISLAVMLTACSKVPTGTNPKDALNVKILPMGDSDSPKEYALICIDGVTYLRTPEGGITVKFQANREGDPSAEECE